MMSEVSGAEAQNLLGIGTWVRQGPAILVTRQNAWVVLVPGTRKQVTEAAWQVLERAPAPEEFLDALVEAAELESAEKIKALLFGFHDGTSATFGVKGTTPIAVYTAEGSQQIAGTKEEPFVLRSVEGVRRTAFGDLPAEDSLGLPRVVAGIVPVRGFVHATVDPAELAEDERAALAEQVEEDGRSIEDPEAKKARAAAPKPPSPPAAGTASSPRVKLPTADRAPGAMPPLLSRGGSAQAQSRSAEPEPTSSAPNMFDGLFAERPAAPAAPAPAAASEPDATPAPAATSAQPAPAAGTTPGPAPADTGSSVTPSAPGTAAASIPDQTPAAAPAPKRRLVSSSLFDRGRRPAPASTSTPAPASPATPPAATRPAPVPAPTPPAAIPTPEPPEEDELTSPPTQVAPIDDDFASAPTEIAPIDDGEHEDPAVVPPAPRRRPTPPQAAGDLENAGAYDDLFGKTVFRRIEDAAVRRPEEDGEEQDPQPSAGPSAATPPPAPGATPPPAPAAAPAAREPEPETVPAPAVPAGGEFIDWVPGVGRTAPEIAQTAARRATEAPRPEQAYPQVHMAARPPAPSTGSRPARIAPPAPTSSPAPHAGTSPPAAPSPARAAAQPAHPPRPVTGAAPPRGGAGQVVGGGVTLTGLVCANGHANSPERSACRACGGPLPSDPRTVVRPPLGAVETTGGERFVLDRTAIIGRRPRASRVSGNEVPQLITVPSPQQDISRSHLELRLEGWHVVALDLGSTNGTTLYRDGYEPVRLRPREGVVLRHGDRLDLGDDVHLMFGERA